MATQVIESASAISGGLIALLRPVLAGVVAPENIRRGYPRDAMATALSSQTPQGLPVVGILAGDLMLARDAAGGGSARYVTPVRPLGQTSATLYAEADIVDQQWTLIVVAGGNHGAYARDLVATIVGTTLARTPSLVLPDSGDATADGSLGPTTLGLTARVTPGRDRPDHRRDDDGLYRRDLLYTLRYARYAAPTPAGVVQQVQYSIVPTVVTLSIPVAGLPRGA